MKDFPWGDFAIHMAGTLVMCVGATLIANHLISPSFEKKPEDEKADTPPK